MKHRSNTIHVHVFLQSQRKVSVNIDIFSPCFLSTRIYANYIYTCFVRGSDQKNSLNGIFRVIFCDK